MGASQPAPTTSACVLLNLRASSPPLAQQRDNFDFFLTIGAGLDNRASPPPTATDFVVVLNGQVGGVGGLGVGGALSCLLVCWTAGIFHKGLRLHMLTEAATQLCRAAVVSMLPQPLPPPPTNHRCAAPARASTRCWRRRRLAYPTSQQSIRMPLGT